MTLPLWLFALVWVAAYAVSCYFLADIRGGLGGDGPARVEWGRALRVSPLVASIFAFLTDLVATVLA